MTLVIGTSINDGVVLVADSRQSYINKIGAPRIASDNARKLFEFNDHVAIATAGQAFFNDPTNNGKLKSIQVYLEEFKENSANQQLTTTLQIAEALKTFTEGFLLPMIQSSIRQAVAKESGTNVTFSDPENGKLQYQYDDTSRQRQQKDWNLILVQFIVAGRDSDGVCHAITVSPFVAIILHNTSSAPSMQWIGQGEVLEKLFTGINPYSINVVTMTAQDAVDFSIILIRTTEDVQKFSDGLVGSQGGIPGVGGPIDLVFIPIKSGNLEWLQQKKLHVNDPRS